MADASITFLQSFGDITSGGVALLSDLFSGDRMIDSIVPDVVMEEISSDTLTTTDHPVETGVAVSDHSFRNPAELEMRVLWSDSTAESVGYSQAVYDELQALQNRRQPFVVQTGKRSYQNMLFRTLVQKTDATSEYSLTVVANFRELITVNSSNASGSSSDATTPTSSSDATTQADPSSTTKSVDSGGSSGTGSQFSTVGPNSSEAFGQMGVDGTGKGITGASGAQFSNVPDGVSAAGGATLGTAYSAPPTFTQPNYGAVNTFDPATGTEFNSVGSNQFQNFPR